MSSLQWLVALWKDLGAKSQKNQRNIINVLTCHSVKSLTEKNSGSLTAVWLFSLILMLLVTKDMVVRLMGELAAADAARCYPCDGLHVHPGCIDISSDNSCSRWLQAG